MKIRISKSILFALALIVSFSSCTKFEDEEKEELSENGLSPRMEAELQRKLSSFKTLIITRCKDEAVQDAIDYVDSLVAEELKILSSDTLKFPNKPIKPQLPEKIILDDSTVISRN